MCVGEDMCECVYIKKGERQSKYMWSIYTYKERERVGERERERER